MGQKLANSNVMDIINDSEKKISIYSRDHTVYISILSLKRCLVQTYKMQR